jgi:E3 ubiquitin-protein ligase SHPRH
MPPKSKSTASLRGTPQATDGAKEGQARDSSVFQVHESGRSTDAGSFGELPNELVEYMRRSGSTSEPPHKRPKTKASGEGDGLRNVNEFDHVVVKQTTWKIKCSSAKLAGIEMPLEREHIAYSTSWDHVGDENAFLKFGLSRTPKAVEFLDEKNQPIYHTSLSKFESDYDDIRLALNIDPVLHKKAKCQGALWTDVGLSLFHEDGFDIIQLRFAVKWNVTSSPAEISVKSNKTPSLLKVLSSYFPDIHVIRSEWAPQDFYTSAYQPKKGANEASIEMGQLKSTLYPFQKRAVWWLLEREDAVPRSNCSELPISFVKAKDAYGRPCYVSHLFGLITTDLTPFKAAENSLRGGILAEEMGLGKTLEMIALITLHTRKRPECSPSVLDKFSGEEVRPTSATLIITPPFLLRQWISEINRHAPQLKIFHYEGLKSKAHLNIQPEKLLENLACSDIVLSTYSVIAAEIYYTPSNPEKSLRRKEPKYPRPKSPLVQLEFWRVVLDEAQMIQVSLISFWSFYFIDER